MSVNFYKNKETNEIQMSIQELDETKWTLLKANTTEAAVEKHIPEVKLEDEKVFVQVGSIIHPMTEAHHIAFIALVTNKKTELKKLNPTGAPTAEFNLTAGETIVAVYEYCNLHGLWVKEF